MEWAARTALPDTGSSRYIQQPAAVLAGLEPSAVRRGEEGGGELDEAAEAEIAGDGEDGDRVVLSELLVPLDEGLRDLRDELVARVLQLLEPGQLETQALQLVGGGLVLDLLDHDVEVLQRDQQPVFFLQLTSASEYLEERLVIGHFIEFLQLCRLLYQADELAQQGEIYLRPLVARRENEEEYLGRFVVQGFEIDTARGTAEENGELFYREGTAVWEGDTVAEAGASQALAILEHLHDELFIGDELLFREVFHHLLQHREFLSAAEMENAELFFEKGNELGRFHLFALFRFQLIYLYSNLHFD